MRHNRQGADCCPQKGSTGCCLLRGRGSYAHAGQTRQAQEEQGESRGFLRARGSDGDYPSEAAALTGICVDSACVRRLAERRVTGKQWGALSEVEEENAAYWAKWDLGGGP